MEIHFKIPGWHQKAHPGILIQPYAYSKTRGDPREFQENIQKNTVEDRSKLIFALFVKRQFDYQQLAHPMHINRGKITASIMPHRPVHWQFTGWRRAQKIMLNVSIAGRRSQNKKSEYLSLLGT